MLVLAFLCTWHVCHNYKKSLYNRNVLLRVRCLVTLLLISAPFFLSKELILYNFVKAKKGKKKGNNNFYKLEVCAYQIFD